MENKHILSILTSLNRNYEHIIGMCNNLKTSSSKSVHKRHCLCKKYSQYFCYETKNILLLLVETYLKFEVSLGT